MVFALAGDSTITSCLPVASTDAAFFRVVVFFFFAIGSVLKDAGVAAWR